MVDPSFTSCSLLRTDRGSARDWSHERRGWLSPEGFLWAGAPRPAAATPGGARGLHRQQHPAGVSGHPQRIREQHHAELHGRLQRPFAQHHGVGYVSRLCLPHVRGCRTRGIFPVQSNDFRHERKDDCLGFLFSSFSAWASHVNTSLAIGWCRGGPIEQLSLRFTLACVHHHTLNEWTGWRTDFLGLSGVIKTTWRSLTGIVSRTLTLSWHKEAIFPWLVTALSKLTLEWSSLREGSV